MNKNISFLYKSYPNRPYCGTLFYCYEYFSFLFDLGLDLDLNIKFYIITNKNVIPYILKAFKTKYTNFEKVKDNIIFIKSEFDLYSKNFNVLKNLDISNTLNTLNILKDLKVVLDRKSRYINTDISYAVSSSSNSISNDLETFGFYDFQKSFKFKERLKFYFDIYTEKPKTIKNKVYNSGFGNHCNKFKSSEFDNIFDSEIINYYKLPNKIDSDNRLIVEAFYYNIKFNIIGNSVFDSVDERLETLQKFGLEPFKLSTNDLIIQYIFKNI